MTNIAHHEDLASMIAAAVGNDAAKGNIFNCVNDRGITLEGMAKLCAKVLHLIKSEGRSRQVFMRIRNSLRGFVSLLLGCWKRS